MQYTVRELRGLFDTLDLIEELSQKYEYFFQKKFVGLKKSYTFAKQIQKGSS